MAQTQLMGIYDASLPRTAPAPAWNPSSQSVADLSMLEDLVDNLADVGEVIQYAAGRFGLLGEENRFPALPHYQGDFFKTEDDLSKKVLAQEQASGSAEAGNTCPPGDYHPLDLFNKAWAMFSSGLALGTAGGYLTQMPPVLERLALKDIAEAEANIARWQLDMTLDSGDMAYLRAPYRLLTMAGAAVVMGVVGFAATYAINRDQLNLDCMSRDQQRAEEKR